MVVTFVVQNRLRQTKDFLISNSFFFSFFIAGGSGSSINCTDSNLNPSHSLDSWNLDAATLFGSNVGCISNYCFLCSCKNVLLFVYEENMCSRANATLHMF